MYNIQKEKKFAYANKNVDNVEIVCFSFHMLFNRK